MFQPSSRGREDKRSIKWEVRQRLNLFDLFAVKKLQNFFTIIKGHEFFIRAGIYS